MTAPTDAANRVFEQVVESFRKTTEATLSAQKDVFQQWQNSWTGTVQPQTPWLDQLRGFQQTWSNTTLELLRKHRDSLDKQYQSGIDALEEAFRVSAADDPDEFRRRAEQLCRRNLDCLKEISEAQLSEFQEATAKWVEMFTNPPSSPESPSEEDAGA